MLVLSRKVDERVLIGEDVELVVVSIKGGTVRFGLRAPAGVEILRCELAPREESKAELAGRKVAC